MTKKIPWEIASAEVTFLKRVLSTHDNVITFSPIDVYYFEVPRKRQLDSLKLVCLPRYTFSFCDLLTTLEFYPDVNVIYCGGNWNAPTCDAKKEGIRRRIGIYNAGEINQALGRSEYWSYVKPEE